MVYMNASSHVRTKAPAIAPHASKPVTEGQLAKQRPSQAPKPADSAIPEDRKSKLLEESARLFGAHGYDKTSMRDIATAFGILPGSLYHHFGSKEELFAAVYAQGVSQFIEAVEAAVESHQEPWARLEAACIAHLEALAARDSSTASVFTDWSTSHSAELRAALVKERDRYEVVFNGLTSAIPLPENISRQYFRLALLGALNWSLTWFKPGKDSPARVAQQILAIFRTPL